MLQPNTRLWLARLVRAVDGRWVRLLYIRMSPVLSFQENLGFQKLVVSDLAKAGFSPLKGSGITPIGTADKYFQRETPLRCFLVFILSLLAPVVSIFLIKYTGWRSPLFIFFLVCGLSLFTGVVIHGLGSVPELILGLTPIRGIKLQLLLPLIIGGFLFLTREEQQGIWRCSLKIKHLVVGGGILLVVGGLYIMRSGNFPLLPVSESERHLRDGLERFMGVRPRLKEFLIGHPLLIYGLYLKEKIRGEKNFFWDGRLFILLGMIGQISILNTFTHFHAPFGQCVLRTIHGIWVGFLLGWSAWRVAVKPFHCRP
jgi:hypothetical protein